LYVLLPELWPAIDNSQRFKQAIAIAQTTILRINLCRHLAIY
jgi:hypothetical protein